jgi:hypothetical protein
MPSLGSAPIGRNDVPDTPARTKGRFRLTSCFLYGPRFPKRKVRISAMGQKQTFEVAPGMSVLPPKADIL